MWAKARFRGSWLEAAIAPRLGTPAVGSSLRTAHLHHRTCSLSLLRRLNEWRRANKFAAHDLRPPKTLIVAEQGQSDEVITSITVEYGGSPSSWLRLINLSWVPTQVFRVWLVPQSNCSIIGLRLLVTHSKKPARAADDFAVIRARIDKLRRERQAGVRAADDFPVIRARMEELRRERAQESARSATQPLPLLADHAGRLTDTGRHRLLRAIRLRIHE